MIASHLLTTISPTDSKWTTEFPYKLIGTNKFKRFQVSNDGKVNQNPTLTREVLSDSDIVEVGAFSSNASDTFLDFDLKSQDGAGDKVIRLFRNTQSGQSTRLDIHSPNASQIQHRFRADGDSQICSQDGNVILGQSGRWDGGLVRFGPIRMWFDASDRLRMKSGSDPSSEADGNIIGAQS